MGDYWPWPRTFPPSPPEKEHHYRRRRHIPPVLGCMDPLATNYNPNATEDDGTCAYVPPQFTPDFTMGVGGALAIQSMTEHLLLEPGYTAHDPNSGINPTQALMNAGVWDGTTIYNHTQTSVIGYVGLIFPSSRVMRGLREYFYNVNPFADNVAPTVTEIEDWQIHIIRHFRHLQGVTVPIEKDKNLFLKAQWSLERWLTQAWDHDYPGDGSTQGGEYGPCVNGDGTPATNFLCGKTFVPNAGHQTMYHSGSEITVNVTEVDNASLYVSIAYATRSAWWWKLAGFLRNLMYQGVLSPTIQPWLTKTKVGIAWHYDPDTETAWLRMKWSD
jgi:hypothetical protein